mmetsp:Transcript_11265/g.47261  ORF Transcript_11265/g.47261 Transcript_11265/m.47261 type:complete len:409 (-) Transcript_11265:1477-2703(-)
MRRRASRARRGRRRLVVPRTDVACAPQRGVHRELVDVPLVIQTPVRTRASAYHERRVVHATERGDNVASLARPSPSREVAVDVKQNLVRVVRRVHHDGDVVPHASGDADVGRERFRARRRRHVVVAPKADRVGDVVAAAAFSKPSGAHQEHAPTPFAEHRDRLARDAFVGLYPRGERQKIVRLQSGVPRRRRRAAAVPIVGGVLRSAPRRDFRVRAVEVHGSRPGSVVRRPSHRRRSGERDVLRGVPQHVTVRPGGDLAVADVADVRRRAVHQRLAVRRVEREVRDERRRGGVFVTHRDVFPRGDFVPSEHTAKHANLVHESRVRQTRRTPRAQAANHQLGAPAAVLHEHAFAPGGTRERAVDEKLDEPVSHGNRHVVPLPAGHRFRGRGRVLARRVVKPRLRGPKPE